MSFTRCCRLLTLLFASSLSLNLPAQNSSEPSEAPPPSHATYPQIVRLSLVEGDVRIALGKGDEKLTGNTWEQAAADIPLQSGFSLATGPDGRAEIEFEDASTIYLAPNTALSLPLLITKDGVPHTTLSLLSGTLTLNIKPDLPGDSYRIETPTHGITLTDGDNNYTRITSYLDGLHVTPMEDTHLVLNHVSRPVPADKTYTLSGYGFHETRTPPATDFTAFDAWVKQRVTSRSNAMKSVMEQAGLKTPLPGLADLAGKGTFVSCAPYGICWQPNDGWVPPHAPQPAPENTGEYRPQPPSPSPHLVLASLELPSPQTAGAFSPYGPFGYDPFDDAGYFPCNPYAFWYYQSALYYPADFYPYDWAVCHAGFWLYRNNHYMWLAGTHKHHHCPVHWVKYQGKLGFVPDHPRDRRGAVPVNLRHGIYTRSERPGHPIERIAFDAKSPPKLVDGTPKDFRNPAPPHLARAEAPQVGVHFLHESPRNGVAGATARTSVSSLTFDQHSNRFMLATRVTEGGHTHTFSEPMSDHGGHIASASAGGYHSGFSSNGSLTHSGFAGGAEGGGFRGGSAGSFHGGTASGGGGGGFHGGGGGGGGGGGSHGGGGGGAGGASSGGGGGGGGHH